LILTKYIYFLGGARFCNGTTDDPEPEFLKILKYNLAESASAGFQFNCFDIFNDETLNYRLLDHLSGLLKCIQKNLFYQQTTIIACPNPIVLSDL
jgi:hypothetical protein